MNEYLQNILYIITGVLALFFSFITYISKKKSKLLIFKGISDLFWAFNFFTLGPLGYAGAIQNFTCVIGRDTICYCKEKKIKSFDNIIWFFVALSFYSLIPILSFKKVGWLCILPLVGSSLSLLSLYVRSPILTKILTIPAQTFCLIYSILVINVFGIIGYSLMIVGAIIGLIRHKLDKNNINTSINNETIND